MGGGEEEEAVMRGRARGGEAEENLELKIPIR